MRQALAAALLIVLSAAACGGDGSGSGSSGSPTPTPEPTVDAEVQAYFDALAGALAETHGEADAIRSALQSGLAQDSEDARRAAVIAYSDSYAAYASAAVDRLETVTAPSTAAALHAALLAAAADLVTLGEALKAAVQQEAPSDQAAFNNTWFNLDGTSIEQRFRDACNDLQALAAASGADADFECTR